MLAKHAWPLSGSERTFYTHPGQIVPYDTYRALGNRKLAEKLSLALADLLGKSYSDKLIEQAQARADRVVAEFNMSLDAWAVASCTVTRSKRGLDLDITMSFLPCVERYNQILRSRY